MRRRPTYLSSRGLLTFAVIPGLVALGLITMGRLVVIAGGCATTGVCP